MPLFLLKYGKWLAGLAVLVPLGIWLWTHVSYVNGLEVEVADLADRNAVLRGNFTQAQQTIKNYAITVETMRLASARRIEVVEVTAERRAERLADSREITKGITDVQPSDQTALCGPWDDYFGRVFKDAADPGTNRAAIPPGTDLLRSTDQSENLRGTGVAQPSHNQ